MRYGNSVLTYFFLNLINPTLRAEVQALTPCLVLAMAALQKHPEESNYDTLYTLDRKVHHLYVNLL